MSALESYEANPHADNPHTPEAQHTVSPERPTSPASSHASMSASKLRYKAYDPPKATPRLRAKRPTSPAYSTTHSEGGSSRFVGQDVEDPMSKTITAGDLALAAEQIELQELAKKRPEKSTASLSQALHSMSLDRNEQVSIVSR